MKTRALVLCEDRWHPAEVVRRGLGALTDSSVGFEFLDGAGRWHPAMLKNFSLVIVAKANHLSATDQQPWLTPATEGAFKDFVQAGGGLVLLHAGTCFKDFPEMRRMTGGAFLSHPEPCAVYLEPLSGHALTAGVSAFTVVDEFYQMAFDATDADVFLHARSAHGVQPAGWTRSEGKGRVGVLTPGHSGEVWLSDGYQKLLRNVLTWSAKLE